MFNHLEADEVRALAEVAQVVQFPAAALIFREGEGGDCAYVVVRGTVQVFTFDRSGDEMILSHPEECDHFGKQSLLPGRSGRRNASLRAHDDVTLLRITRDDFQNVLSRRDGLKDLLAEAGQRQLRHRAVQSTRLVRMWALFMFMNGFISIGILCGLAMVFQTPFIFPSLGATAFLVFFTPTVPATSPRNALCGHALGIVCGFGALCLTGLQHAGPAVMTQLSWTRVVAAALSLAATGALMILLNVPHPPAAATTLIVPLGVVTRPSYLIVLELAVSLLVGQAIVINRLTGVRYPFWTRVPARRATAPRHA